MGVTAGVSSVAEGVAATSLFSPVGAGVGSIFVAGCLVLLVAYYNLVETTHDDQEHVRTMLIALLGPLLLTFTGIVLFESFQVIG